MLYKVLNALYPERLDLYVSAVRVALEASETDHLVNRGAVFVRTLRDFSEIAGIDLGLKPLSDGYSTDDRRNPGSQIETSSPVPDVLPSVNDAIWAETQLMLRRQMTQATYDAIIQGTVLLNQDDNKYVIGVHNEMAKEWLENRLHDIVRRTLSSVVGVSVDTEFQLMKE